jgi:hypothetical protein
MYRGGQQDSRSSLAVNADSLQAPEGNNPGCDMASAVRRYDLPSIARGANLFLGGA